MSQIKSMRKPEAILVINSGSSSLKFSAFTSDEALKPFLRGQIEGLFTNPHFTAHDGDGNVIGEKSWAPGTKLGHDGAVEYLFDFGGSGVMAGHTIVSAGHRVVHGGTVFTEPVLIDDSVIEALEKLVPLAPLHQPYNIAAIRAVRKREPGLPQAACFDTSFHRTQPTSGAYLRHTEDLYRRRGQAVRLPRPIVRIHNLRPAGVRRDARLGPCRDRTPRERREHVRGEGRK